MRWMKSPNLPLFSHPDSPLPRPSQAAANPPIGAEIGGNPDAASPARGRNIGDGNDAISVSELNRRVKNMLEAKFALGWVRGELSNVMRAASGHWYFSLKDDAAQVRCVMFRSRAQGVSFTPTNGIEVEVRALPSLYEARGEFQLGVETMRRAGQGALFEAFERLKRTLAAEGLFDADAKRELPTFPTTIGIVTSTRAAALHDVLTTFRRRAPMVRIIIYPTAVQGANAPDEIAAAIDAARTRAEVDALLICRGGGSMEDLWAFNDEAVARAVHRLQRETAIVVVSGVGHETDFTICDFVADARAPTPTAGAEMLSPDCDALLNALTLQRQQLQRGIRRQLWQCQQRLDMAARGLMSPQQRLSHERERITQQRTRLQRAVALHVHRASDAHIGIASAMTRAISQQLQARQQLLAQRSQALHLLSPDNVLTRGYAIVQKGDGSVVSRAREITLDDAIQVRLQDGVVGARVTDTAARARRS